jgi:hypothetical protein
MALTVDEATRIVQFCLAGDGWGKASADGDTLTIHLMENGTERARPYEFRAESFEAALQAAVEAGVLKAAAVDKQIAFLQRTTSRPGRGGGEPPRFHEAPAAVSALIHETQRERGISSLYAASGGRLFQRELTLQWRNTERRRAGLDAFRDRCAGPLPGPASGRLTAADEALAEAMVARAALAARKMRPPELIAAYSRANRIYLQAIDALLPTVTDAGQRATALAWVALLNAKEKLGIERAQLVAAFARDRYAGGQYQAVLGLIAARDRYLHLFSDAAPAPARELLQEQLASEVASAVRRMEEVALARRRGGFGVDPTDWFTAISAQIDRLAALEAAVRTTLAGAGLGAPASGLGL